MSEVCHVQGARYCLSDMLGTLSVLSVCFCGFTGKMHMNDSKTN